MKNINLFIFILFVNILLSEIPINEIYKQRRSIVFEVKRYNISSTEEIILYGGKEKKFINNNLYWGEAGYGALSGKRGGYLEGGLILGYQSYKELVNIDYRLFIGAGGGGSAPQGGGFILNPTIGIGPILSPKWNCFLDFGYIKFLNGDISSKTIAFNINRFFWHLFIKE